MTIRRGFGSEMKDSVRGGMNTGPRTFWIPTGTETVVTLLDDTPACLYRHQLFIKGDKTAAGLRQTCADQGDDPAPRTCLICNAMLRYDQIGRKPFIYLSLIDERQFVHNGKEYKDMKLLLELDKKGGELFQRRKEAHGTLAGMRFRVYRSTAQNSARYGDSWEKLDIVDLVTHYWYSPAVPKIIEASSRRGERPISHEQAVGQMVAPYNYDEIMEAYKPADAEKFIAYLEGERGMAQGQATQGAGQGYQAPPPPPGRGGPSAPPPPQGQHPGQHPGAVPASQVPNYAPQPQGYQGQPQYAPQGQPQGAPPQGYGQAPPPRVPDPRGAAPAQGAPAYAPPPPPQRGPAQPQHAPQGQPQYAPPPPQGHPGYPPQGQPQGAPPQPNYAPPPPPARQPGPGPVPQGYGAPPPPQGAPAYTPPPPPGAPAQPGTGLPPQAGQFNFETPPQGGAPGWSPPSAAGGFQSGPPQPPQNNEPEPDLPF